MYDSEIYEDIDVKLFIYCDDVVYMIYIFGLIGNLKGMMLVYRGVVNLYIWMKK